jgi:hypothetical protein
MGSNPSIDSRYEVYGSDSCARVQSQLSQVLVSQVSALICPALDAKEPGLSGAPSVSPVLDRIGWHVSSFNLSTRACTTIDMVYRVSIFFSDDCSDTRLIPL